MGYVFDNQHAAAKIHHEALAQLLDPITRQVISELMRLEPASDPDGGYMLTRPLNLALDAGAGAGGIDRWLVDQAPDVQVVAVDKDTNLLPTHARIQPVAHDLTDPDWPSALDGLFHLAVVRLLLAHLAAEARERVLAMLIERLAPGGTILIQSWIPAPLDEVVVMKPTDAAADAYVAYQRAFNAIFAEAGGSPDWARHLHGNLLYHGLDEVDTTTTSRYWTGGGPGMRLVGAAAAQLEPQLLDRMGKQQLAELRDALDNQLLVVRGHVLYSVSGRKPG